MGKRSKNLILFTTIIIFLIVVVASVIKVYTNHIDSLYAVVENKIEENCKKCFLEELCTGKSTTLGELISKGYLESQINPISKEYVSEDLIVNFDGEKCSTSIR